MASGSQAAATVPYGVITLAGQQYIERPQIFCLELVVNQPYEVFTNQRLTLPGVADFLLKGLTRDSQITGFSISSDLRFRFRITNAEGSTSFLSGGLGIFDDRIIDTCCFGTAQFPYPLIPPIPVHASGSLIFEVEDLGFYQPAPPNPSYPYTIRFGFHGSYLIPLAQANPMQLLSYTPQGGSTS
jgi:hypothetical protein